MSDQNNNPNRSEDFDAFLKEFAPKSDTATETPPHSPTGTNENEVDQPAYGLGDDFNPQATESGFAGFDLNNISPSSTTQASVPQTSKISESIAGVAHNPSASVEQDLAGFNIPSEPTKSEPSTTLGATPDDSLFGNKPTAADALIAAGVAAGATKAKPKFSWSSLFGKKDKTPKPPKSAKTKAPKGSTTKPMGKSASTPKATGDKKTVKPTKTGFSLFGKKPTKATNKTTSKTPLAGTSTTHDGTTPLSSDDPIASILAKDNKTAKIKKGVRPPKGGAKGGTPSDSKKRITILLGVLIALVLAAVVAFMLLNREPEPAPLPPPTVTPESPPMVEEPPMTDPATDVLPDTAPVINPDEILNGEIPDDPALLKEEIDRLSDTDSRLTQQSQNMEEQLVLLEKINEARAEQIALLEAQIAEFEKTGDSTSTTDAPPTPSAQ